MDFVTRGAVAGFLATGPMTYCLMEIFKSLPRTSQRPMPPAKITKDLLGRATVLRTFISHFGYGAAVAIPYSYFFSRTKKSIFVKGPLYGLAIWGASYLGLLPALGVRSQAVRMSPSRNAMMIASHLVWGFGVAWAEKNLRQNGNQMFLE
jgi:uncharacterized membrane protein YagU involved in acid resistance